MHLCVDFHAGPSKEYLIFFLFIVIYLAVKQVFSIINPLFSHLNQPLLANQLDISNLEDNSDEEGKETVYQTEWTVNVGQCSI